MLKHHVWAWNSEPPIFWDTFQKRRLPADYSGLCDLNGFMYSTGLDAGGRRFWYNVEAVKGKWDQHAQLILDRALAIATLDIQPEKARW
jgi:hypothetical protein